MLLQCECQLASYHTPYNGKLWFKLCVCVCTRQWVCMCVYDTQMYLSGIYQTRPSMYVEGHKYKFFILLHFNLLLVKC